MPNTFVVSRAQLIYALCLPLAILVGYLLAEPLDSGSLALVLCVIGVLSVPILMRWYHPLLIVSWNACITPYFVPGRPYLWMLMAFAGLAFAVLNRAVDSDRRFINVPSLTKSLAFLLAVVVITAMMTGGIGVRALGSEHYGGRRYVQILAAVVGYFVLTSQRIPPHRVGLCIGLFFLSGLTSMVSSLAYMGGTSFYFLFALFPPEFAAEQAVGENALNSAMTRIGGLSLASAALSGFLLARYGLRGTLSIGKPLRLICFLVALSACVASGYRSALILFLLTYGVVFILEGPWRSRASLIAAGGGIALATALVFGATKLPLVAQRALSFLPITVDPVVRDNATASSQWRLEMWRMLLPEIPKYLIIGKGYTINPNDMFMAHESSNRGFAPGSAGSMVTGDYHNGPLSVLIPFGIFGTLAFLWFIGAGFRVLYLNYKYGDQALRNVNVFLLAAFVAKFLFFLFIFGGLSFDLFTYTGLLGLSVSLNGGVSQPAPEMETAPAEELEFA
jgi:hypothetical protein